MAGCGAASQRVHGELSVGVEFMRLPAWFLRRDESPGRFSQQEQAFSSNRW